MPNDLFCNEAIHHTYKQIMNKCLYIYVKIEVRIFILVLNLNLI